ncbi:LysR family transcriptional regulator [Pseudoduganella sp. UC29_71]|uniref:LysR family transcriptional regulator n=1 Tax=Pseudoduganella sp. UC29_71 TaxID=3350174 RepID=UPI00366E23D4
MIDLDDIRFVQHLVKAGSMAATARGMNVTPSAVTQRLQQMEKRYGVVLVDRSYRQLRLTGEGELLHEKGAAICADTDELFDLLKARSGQIAGHLQVEAPFGFGRRYLAPLIGEFHAAHPGLKVSLSLFDRLQAQGRNASDIVFFIGELRDSSMVRHPIASNRRLLCASPAYLRARGVPADPDDLAHHDCITLNESNEDVSLWRLTRGKAARCVRIAPALSCNDGEVVRDWAIGGKGIAMRSEWDVADFIRSGKLVQVLPAWSMPPADIVALVPQRKRVPARARAFLDFVRARFAPLPPWRADRGAGVSPGPA